MPLQGVADEPELVRMPGPRDGPVRVVAKTPTCFRLATLDGHLEAGHRVWGWNYRTLQDHLEVGQMDFEIWKWLDTGHVEFRTRRFSHHARVRNPVVGLGLRLFGRREQVRFARRACARMASLTAAGLGQVSEVS